MKTLPAVLSALLIAAPASAELVIFHEFANIEVAALSNCPADPVPEPDFGKHFVAEVIGTSPDLLAQMDSTCGEAQMGARLAMTASTGLINGSFGSSTSLDTHGGGYTRSSADISFRVDVPTAYTFACVGQTAESGDPDNGSMEIRLSGGAIDHSNSLTDDFDLEWSGVLMPGVDYTLAMHSGGERSTRAVGGNYLFMNGSTIRAASFALSFVGDVVEGTSRSVGRVKDRY